MFVRTLENTIRTTKKPHLEAGNAHLFSRFEHSRSQTGLRVHVGRWEKTGASIIHSSFLSSQDNFIPLIFKCNCGCWRRRYLKPKHPTATMSIDGLTADTAGENAGRREVADETGGLTWSRANWLTSAACR